MADKQKLAKLWDEIPYVLSTAHRAERFPTPDLYQRVQRRDTGCIEEWNGTSWVAILCPGGGGGSFVQAEYVTMALDAGLDNERVLTAGTNIAITDGGANSTVTVDGPTATSRGAGQAVYAGTTSRVFQFKSFVAGTGVTLTSDADTITVSADGGGLSCPLYCGTGSPEGVVTGEVGAPYEQTDAATTTHPLWVHRDSSTSNTGWRGWAGLRGANATSFAIGDSASATASHAIAFGEGATASAADALAIGRATSNAADQINVGRANAFTPQSGSTAAGQILIGRGNALTESAAGAGDKDIVIGTLNTVESSYTGLSSGDIVSVIGTRNVVEGTHLQVFGDDCVVGPATAIGGTAIDTADYGVIIGNNVMALADCFSVVGYDARAYGLGAVAFGPHSRAGVNADSSHTTALGRYAWAYADNGVALGPNTTVGATHTGSIALGANAVTTDTNQLMIGGAGAEVYTIYFNGNTSHGISINPGTGVVALF